MAKRCSNVRRQLDQTLNARQQSIVAYRHSGGTRRQARGLDEKVQRQYQDRFKTE
ncbi:MAG: hypothetical protein HWQ42_16335 [Nostoc sp. JL23]|uniref:hypothetical protein n=1 Tax=Nostoc sp. TaxID=1180 RepID=UPI001DE4604F|nr:hypothetical protein [Nostoc sp. JL23]